jgi:2-polyprenyl-3-methyl-5-hydroxy-6-metoxy-1,4-benzoquinol methylase
MHQMKATRKKEWFDEDSFWRELYPFMFSKERIAQACEQIAKVLALTKTPGRSVLDLCCGPGRCSVSLAKRGFAVTGVDRTKYLLDKAKAKARAAHVKIEWVQKDMLDFVRKDHSSGKHWRSTLGNPHCDGRSWLKTKALKCPNSTGPRFQLARPASVEDR